MPDDPKDKHDPNAPDSGVQDAPLGDPADNPPQAPGESAESPLGKSMAGELVQIRSMGKIGRVQADTGSDLTIKLSPDLEDRTAPVVEHIAYDDVVRAARA